MSRRLIVSGGSRPLELVLVGTMIVGRDPACDISETNDPLMSRRHAAFNAGPREVMVRDLGSRNGILVNGVKTPESMLHQRRRRADRPSAGAIRRRGRARSTTCRSPTAADQGGDAATTKILDHAAVA